MSKHWVWCLLASVALSACSRSTQLAVRAVSEAADGSQVGRAQLEIKVLPYDRDSIFDALAALAAEPEPQPPADLLELRDSVAAAQEAWREAESAWNEAYSEQKDLAERMKGMNTASDEYFKLFQRFNTLDDQVKRLNRAKTGYFDRFTSLQKAYTERADSFSAVDAAWSDVAFESYGEIVDSLVKERGEELADTTDTGGWAYFVVPRGKWWVHTRFSLPFQELYWNVPYQSAGGVDTLLLSDSNAVVRSRF